jgi:hypothetical protein
MARHPNAQQPLHIDVGAIANSGSCARACAAVGANVADAGAGGSAGAPTTSAALTRRSASIRSASTGVGG